MNPTNQAREPFWLCLACGLGVAAAAFGSNLGGLARTNAQLQAAALPPFSLLSEWGNASVGQGALVWGDADRDGDLDLLITGGRFDSIGFRASILRNDRDGLLGIVLAELSPLGRGDVGWADFDRDGDLDALVTGLTESQNVSTVLHRNDLPTGFPTVGLTRLPSLTDSALAWADADGDGDVDVLLCGSGTGESRQAGLYLNNGSGSFSNGLVALPPVSLGAVAWADFDNDGAPDFVITGSTDGTAAGAVSRLYRNLGGGAFVEVPAGLPPVFRSALAWADYDRDGDPDLLIAGASLAGPVTQLFRNDAGVLTLVLSLPGVVDGALAWGDANFDGFPDLALSGRQGNTEGPLLSRVYWNQAGTLVDSGAPLPALHLSAMAWGDFDFDGRLDLALAGSTNPALTLFSGGALTAVFRNNTTGLIPPPPPAPIDPLAGVAGSDVTLRWALPAGAPAGLSFEVRVGKTPGGSQVISALADPATGTRRMAQAGQAGWSGRWALRNLAPGTYYWSVQSVDSAYRGSTFTEESSFTINNAQPTISVIPSQTIAINSLLGPLDLTVNDADGDAGALTVSVASSNTRVFPPGAVEVTGSGSARHVTFRPATNEGGTVTIIFTVRDPDGGLGSSSTRVTVQSLVDVQAGFKDGEFHVLEPADVDNDGDLDVFMVGTEFISPGSGRVTVRMLLNAGNATFTSTAPPLPLPSSPYPFAAWGDYDGDGDVDLFYNGSVYRNDGGSLVNVATVASGIEEGMAAWGDYDYDGDLDLAVSGRIFLAGGFVTRIFRNDGNGVFTPLDLPLQPMHGSSLAWGDPDGDGNLDLAVAGAAAEDPTLSAVGRIYRNLGGDRFVEAASFLGVVDGTLTWGDVNGDGRADLIVAGFHGVQLINNVQLNLGGWQFSILPLQVGGTIWQDARLLDWDGDGDLDLLTGINSVVGVYLNPGTGEFPTSAAASASLRCRALRFGDFDGDGDYDVLATSDGTSSTGGQTRLLRNPRVSTQPAPPSSLTATVDGDSVLLRWPGAPAVHGAPVTYNVRVGTGRGRGDVLTPMSRSDGWRLVPQPGNVGFATTLRLRQLPAGTYFWSVQPVDVSWHGGPWVSEGSFVIATTQNVRIVSFEQLSASQVRLRFNAPGGRVVAVEASNDLASWFERTSITVGIGGTGQIDTYLTGDRTFFRLSLR